MFSFFLLLLYHFLSDSFHFAFILPPYLSTHFSQSTFVLLLGHHLPLLPQQPFLLFFFFLCIISFIMQVWAWQVIEGPNWQESKVWICATVETRYYFISLEIIGRKTLICQTQHIEDTGNHTNAPCIFSYQYPTSFAVYINIHIQTERYICLW